jgi:hypothetical protein
MIIMIILIVCSKIYLINFITKYRQRENIL